MLINYYFEVRLIIILHNYQCFINLKIEMNYLILFIRLNLDIFPYSYYQEYHYFNLNQFVLNIILNINQP